MCSLLQQLQQLQQQQQMAAEQQQRLERQQRQRRRPPEGLDLLQQELAPLKASLKAPLQVSLKAQHSKAHSARPAPLVHTGGSALHVAGAGTKGCTCPVVRRARAIVCV